MLTRNSVVLGVIISSVFIFDSIALAVGSSGFENASLSTRSLSRGNASVADAESADAVAFNPAGLSDVDGNEVVMGSSFIHSATHYKGAEGRIDEDASESMITVPHFYTALKMPHAALDRLTLGVGSNAPFGLITKYSSTGNFRHIAYYNDLKTMAFHASLAYELNPSLSVGIGASHLEVGLKQVGKFNSAFLTGTAQDATFEYDVDGQGQGWNVGVLWKPSDHDTIGIFYRNEVRAHLKGTMSTHDLTGVMATVFGGPSNVTSADTDITFPGNATVGYKRQFNEKLDWEFDFGWTGWSSFDEFDSTFGTSNAILNGFSTLPKDYKDVFSFNTGGTFNVNERLSISSGYFYYERAANRSNYTNENPDGDRHGVDIGFSYNFGNWSVEMMYMAIWVIEEEIENTAGAANGADIDGSYSGFIQIAASGITYHF